jgi:hypothetical protein
MKTAIDKISYGTGDQIILTAKVTDLGKPVTGLTEIYAKVIRPEDGAGNWFSANKVSAAQLKKIPELRGNEKLSGLQRKAIFLTDIRKAAYPKWTILEDIRLYDDGTHGDVMATDGIYTNHFAGTIKEGTYSFYFKATSQENSINPFDREDMIQKYITVNAVPEYSDVNVILTDTSIGDNNILWYHYDVKITPKDGFGNYMRPGSKVHATIIYNDGSSGGSVKLNDNLDGTYSGPISVSQTDIDKGAKLGVDIDGKTFTSVEPPPLRGKWSISLHSGYTFPTGNFGTLYNGSYMFGLNFDYHFKPQWSLVGFLGYNHFKAATPVIPNTQWWNLSANLKYEFNTNPLRPYMNGGCGIYIPKAGNVKPGVNIGLGWDFSLNPNLIIEIGGDYHHIFTVSNAAGFFTAHTGLIFRF